MILLINTSWYNFFPEQPWMRPLHKPLKQVETAPQLMQSKDTYFALWYYVGIVP